MYTINLLIGDVSGDGHEKVEKIAIYCPVSSEELKQAYEQGTKKLGYNFSEQVACDFEEPFITMTQYNALFDFGLELPDLEWDDADEKVARIYADDFMQCYMFICELGDPLVRGWKLQTDVKSIDIGGYGLFE